jgi:TetR/AcrR family fatty acid metabolism transcriptional regulator
MQDNKYDIILDAASQVFASEGFHKAKISKIAEIAGIGAGTIYLYFRNKEAILEEIFIRSWSRIESKLIDMKKIRNMTVLQKIAEITGEIIELIASNVAVAKILLYEYSFWNSNKNQTLSKRVSNSQKLIEELIQEGIKEKIFRSNINPKEATIFIIGGVWFWTAAKSDEFSKVPKEELTEALYNYIVRGLS